MKIKFLRKVKGRKTSVQAWESSWVGGGGEGCPDCRPVNKQGMVIGYVSQYKAAQGMVARKLRKGEEER